MVDCGAGVEVLDAWAEVRSVTGTYRDGTLALSGKVCAAVLFRNAEGAADYREALLDFEDSVPCAADGEWTLRAQVDRIAYRVTGSAIEMRADVTVASPAMAMQSCTVLRSMTPDPQRPKAQDASCALILYYAAGGERLWDIARQYNTTEAAIRAASSPPWGRKAVCTVSTRTATRWRTVPTMRVFTTWRAISASCGGRCGCAA